MLISPYPDQEGNKLQRPNSNFCKPLKNNSKVVRPTRSPRQQWPPRRTKNGDLSIVSFSRVGLRTYQHPCNVSYRLKVFKSQNEIQDRSSHYSLISNSGDGLSYFIFRKVPGVISKLHFFFSGLRLHTLQQIKYPTRTKCLCKLTHAVWWVFPTIHICGISFNTFQFILNQWTFVSTHWTSKSFYFIQPMHNQIALKECPKIYIKIYIKMLLHVSV